MRGFLCLMAIVLGAEISSVVADQLLWDNPNKPGVVNSFTIFATGPLPSPTVRKATVTTNALSLNELMGNAPSGIYWVWGISLATNGLASERSKTFILPWTAPEGAALARGGACNTVVHAHEATGLLIQTCQDPIHSYTATSFKSPTSGRACKVELNLRKVNRPGGAITVYVWADKKGRPGTLLATSRTGLDTTRITDGWYEAEIPFDRLRGETYWVGFANSSVDRRNNLLWLGGGKGARCHSGDGVNWVFSANEAMNIRVYE
jgi:hypothetical protein